MGELYLAGNTNYKRYFTSFRSVVQGWQTLTISLGRARILPQQITSFNNQLRLCTISGGQKMCVLMRDRFPASNPWAWCRKEVNVVCTVIDPFFA